MQCRIDESLHYSYLTEELRALEKATNFIKWIQNNLTDDMVKNIIERYETEIKNDGEEMNEEIIEDESEVIGIFNETFNKNHKLEIALSIYNGIKYVTIQAIRRKKNKILWEKAGKFNMTINRFSKILRRAKEIVQVE